MGGQKERLAINAVAILVYTIQKRWEEKKLAAALFMDMKKAFNYISKGQLIAPMVKLRIDRDLILWTRSFLIDRKVELVIDGHENSEREIETGISQDSSASPIFFLIYISGIFEKVTKICPLVTFVFFIDDLTFIALGSSVKKMGKTLEKVAKMVIKWGI